MESFERWFVVKRIDLTDTTAHGDLDYPFGPDSMVGRWVCGVSFNAIGNRGTLTQE